MMLNLMFFFSVALCVAKRTYTEAHRGSQSGTEGLIEKNIPATVFYEE